MKRVQAILAVALALSLAGCILRGKPQTAKVTTPVPKPAPTPPPAPPPRVSLSTPQTHVELPQPQPVNPDALATTQLPGEQAEAPPAPKPVRRRAGPVAAPPPKVEPQPAPPPPVAAEPERPAIGEIVPADQQKRLQESAQNRKRLIRQLVDQAQARGLTGNQKGLITRIEQFVKLSDDNESSGNMRQADELADRGLILARELQNGR